MYLLIVHVPVRCDIILLESKLDPPVTLNAKDLAGSHFAAIRVVLEVCSPLGFRTTSARFGGVFARRRHHLRISENQHRSIAGSNAWGCRDRRCRFCSDVASLPVLLPVFHHVFAGIVQDNPCIALFALRAKRLNFGAQRIFIEYLNSLGFRLSSPGLRVISICRPIWGCSHSRA